MPNFVRFSIMFLIAESPKFLIADNPNKICSSFNVKSIPEKLILEE